MSNKMYRHISYRRVSYADTDRMGYLYYGRYAEYYEVARVEALRDLGLRYKDMEDDDDVMLPVTHLEIKYIRPATYDENIRIETILAELPGRDIDFEFYLYNEKDRLINRGRVRLTFVSKSTGKRCGVPTFLLNKLLPYFE